MKLGDICVSREYSEKFSKAGIKFSDTLFWWANNGGDDWVLVHSIPEGFNEIFYPSPCPSELLAILPDRIIKDKTNYWLHILKSGLWAISYEFSEIEVFKYFENSNFLTAVCEMILWLKKEGYLK